LLLVEAVLFAAGVLVTMLALDEILERSVIAAGACYLFNILMYVSPLIIVVSNFYFISIYLDNMKFIFDKIFSLNSI